MIFYPTVIAQYAASVFIGLMVLYAAVLGLRIIVKWNITSGSELQLNLERRTYLISTILNYVFAFELITFFLYIYTADQLHSLFVGAMCAAGTLRVNEFGYPTLILKMVNFILAGLWLIINYVDNRGYDYPLIRPKYLLLLFIAPLVLAEAFIQTRFFLLLRPNIITSCCGSLFSTDSAGVTGSIVGLPPIPMEIIFYASAGILLAAGIFFLRVRKGSWIFGSLSAAHLIIALLAILSFISPYFYELPTHHCPFCILQGEYGYIGYPLYGSLFGGAVTGIGTGILTPFRRIKSLSGIVPMVQIRLTVVSLILVFIFAAIVTIRLLTTDFILVS